MSIFFEYPWVLWGAIPLFGGLFYAYLSKKNTIRLILPSTLFITTLKPTISSGRRKIHLPLWFILDLLLLFLLLIGAAGISSTQDLKEVTIILDASLSMGATTDEGETLFNIAKEKVEALIQSFSPSTKVTMIPLGGLNTHLIERGSIQEVKTALETIKAPYGKDGLSPSRIAPLQEKESDRIYIFSEKKASLELPSRRFVPSKGLELPRRNNIALSVSSDSTTQLVVTLHSFSEQPCSILIKGRTSSTTVPLEKASFILSPKEQQERTLPQPGPDIKSIFFTTTAECDVLPADNEQQITSVTPSHNALLLSEISLETLGLDRLKGWSFKKNSQKSLSEKFSLAIAYETLPDRFTTPTLVVLPQVQGQLTSLTRWDEFHPLTRYVKFSRLTIPLEKELSLPSWATPFLWSEKGIVGYRGEQEGNPVVVTALNPFPYVGKERPETAIFLLNILSYLSSNASTFNASIDEEESNLIEHSTYSLPTSSVQSESPENSGKDSSLLYWCSIAGAGLLIIERLLLLRRNRK